MPIEVTTESGMRRSSVFVVMSVVAGSLRGEVKHCEVPHASTARVEMTADRNECDADKAWGVDNTGIWVRTNRQGAFRVISRH